MIKNHKHKFRHRRIISYYVPQYVIDVISDFDEAARRAISFRRMDGLAEHYLRVDFHCKNVFGLDIRKGS